MPRASTASQCFPTTNDQSTIHTQLTYCTLETQTDRETLTPIFHLKKKIMDSKFRVTIAATLAVLSIILGLLNPANKTLSLFAPSTIPGSHDQLHKAEIIQVTGALGPESLAFDPNGEGPYTGVADGRILKWQGPALGWTDFAFTTSNRY